MRWVLTVVSAAILIVLVYLFVGWMVDGYFGGNIVPNRAVPDEWAAPNSWAEWRDIVIVILGLFWVFAGILTIALLLALILLVFALRNLLRENAAPVLDSLKSTLDNARGTTEFVGETVASPIIRVYSVVSGVRNGVKAIGNLPDRIRGRKKKGRKK
jgi:ABC-type Fe3+ transport system permease subunit